MFDHEGGELGAVDEDKARIDPLGVVASIRAKTRRGDEDPAAGLHAITASAEDRLAGPRWAAAIAASSARSAGEYGAGALAPANGVARCPAGPPAASASRYSADRQVPRVETARPARPATQNASITS